MDADDRPSAEQARLPEFRVADPVTWPGNPDFDIVDIALTFPEYYGATIWRAQGADFEAVGTLDDLVSHIGQLGDNRFGVLKCRVDGRYPFAQTLRVGDAWIVEVHDGTDGDWASRVVRGERTMQQDVLDPSEAFTADEAATIMWQWLAGELPAGLTRVSLR